MFIYIYIYIYINIYIRGLQQNFKKFSDERSRRRQRDEMAEKLDSIKFNIYLALFLMFIYFLFLSSVIVLLGVMGGIHLTPLWFVYLFIYLFDPVILIIRLNSLRNNSAIFLESSYWRGVLWPRCWIKVNFRCRSWNCLGLFDL